MGTVRQVWHIDLGNDRGDDTFVPVSTGHFIPDFEFTFGRNINFNQFDYTAWKDVVFFQDIEFLFDINTKLLFLIPEVVFDCLELFLNIFCKLFYDAVEGKTVDCRKTVTVY